ncbi:MAG: response regulator [Eubacterium sp.]|nr:response regulator [Eubacterium sp.]
MKDREDIRIVIIEIQQSVVVRGIKNKLQDLRYQVTELGANFRDISSYTGKADLFVLYLSESITDDIDNMTLLNQIVDEVDTKGQPMILVGEREYMNEISREKPNLKDFERLLLPIDMSKLGSMIDQMVEDEGEGGRKRILIVDDDPTYAKVVRGWIGDAYQTNIVTNGTQAITFLVKNKVDLILLDYEMPIVDGPKVLEMIRSEESIRDIPVVFLTGVGTKESVSRVMSLDPAGYILKSTTRENLLGKIRAVLSKT